MRKLVLAMFGILMLVGSVGRAADEQLEFTFLVTTSGGRSSFNESWEINPREVFGGVHSLNSHKYFERNITLEEKEKLEQLFRSVFKLVEPSNVQKTYGCKNGVKVLDLPRVRVLMSYYMPGGDGAHSVVLSFSCGYGQSSNAPLQVQEMMATLLKLIASVKDTSSK